MPRDSELAGGSCPCLLVLHRRETRFHSALQSSQIGHFSLFVSVCRPALAGEFLTTGPPGKPLHLFFFFKARFRGFVFPWKNQLCSGSLPGESTSQSALGPTHASISLYCSVGATPASRLKDESRSCKSGHLLYHLEVEVFPRASLVSLLL